MKFNKEEDIKDFKLRIETEPEWCQQLFRESTIKLLAYKYAYYIHAEEIVKDITYDIMEDSWYVMGRALELIHEEETSPCIDFDPKHPLAEEGIKLANKFLKKENV